MRRPDRLGRVTVALFIGLSVMAAEVAMAAPGGLHFAACFANNGARGCTSPPHNSIGDMVGVAVTRRKLCCHPSDPKREVAGS